MTKEQKTAKTEVFIGNRPNVINVGDMDSPKWLEVPECTADVLNCECEDCKDQYLQDTGMER